MYYTVIEDGKLLIQAPRGPDGPLVVSHVIQRGAVFRRSYSKSCQLVHHGKETKLTVPQVPFVVQLQDEAVTFFVTIAGPLGTNFQGKHPEAQTGWEMPQPSTHHLQGGYGCLLSFFTSASTLFIVLSYSNTSGVAWPLY
jgi:hypothetical protein